VDTCADAHWTSAWCRFPSRLVSLPPFCHLELTAIVTTTYLQFVSLQSPYSSLCMILFTCSVMCSVAFHFGVRPLLGIFEKNTKTHVALRGNFSCSVSATDLVEASKDVASLLICTRKKFFAWGVRIFCEWRHKWRSFRPRWPTFPGPASQPFGGSISL